MEPKDTAFESFKALISRIDSDYWNGITNEAETRKRIIDPIFSDILGWAEADVHLENQAGTGFIDYRLTVDGLTRVIVEAKQHERDLGLTEGYAGRFFKLNGSVFKHEAAREGIEQAIRYCGHKNAELACVTNGRQWFAFRGNRLGDGKDTLDGKACCFSSLEAVEAQFSLFYDLLSYESVSNFLFRPIFQEAEGQPLRTRNFRAPVRTPESRIFLHADRLHTDIDRIMVSFFQDLSGEDDPEARRACFVTTEESNSAEKSLLRISEELRNHVKAIDSSDGGEITEAIKRVQEMKHKELVLLIGTKSAGKTTFIERFFTDVLPQVIADDTVTIRIDFATCEADASTVIKWLDEHFLEVAEHAAFAGGVPEYNDIEGMYWKEYDRWRKGTMRHLYETNKDQFKIEFGKHIERRREERPHEYIVHLMHRIVGGLSKVPCLIFDNADHFGVDFQEEVFKYAYSLHRECLCLVLLPITDTTSWEITKEGAMQSFYTESLFLPTPPTELILKKRVEYIEFKVKDEKPERAEGYFGSKGIHLSITNINAFVSCLQSVFIGNEEVGQWIGRLTNQQVRRSLQLTREVVASPHIEISDLIKSYMERSTIVANKDNIMMAIIRGKYDIYVDINTPFVKNIFNIGAGVDTTPLLGVRLLAYFNELREHNPDNDARYIAVKDAITYFQVIGVEPHVSITWIKGLFDAGLVISYNPQINSLTPEVRLEISPSGQQHLDWSISNWIYLESMAEVTPLFSSEVVNNIRIAISGRSGFHRRKAIELFIDYIVDEDARYCKYVQHASYYAQNRIISLLEKQKSRLESPIENGRYARLVGRLSGWHAEKGYGFINPVSGGRIFVHAKRILDYQQGDFEEGTLVEYEIGEGEGRGPIALRVVRKRE